MATTICWTHEDMIAATLEWWGDDAIDPTECEVVGDTDGQGETYLVVRHKPTGRTSVEAGDGGRWHADGTAY